MIFFYQIILAVGLAVGLVSAQPRGRVPSFNELLKQGTISSRVYHRHHASDETSPLASWNHLGNTFDFY
jgi:hypothetical protein